MLKINLVLLLVKNISHTQLQQYYNDKTAYRYISINLNVVEKSIYFNNSTQIVKLVY